MRKRAKNYRKVSTPIFGTITTCAWLILSAAQVTAAQHEITEPHADPMHLQVYTHGDTQFARFGDDGVVRGRAQDVLSCAADHANFTFNFDFAPLSRATAMLHNHEHMLWFPSGPSDDPERQRRMMGPLGQIDILWYQHKSHLVPVTSDTFMQQARVTAYKGSVFEDQLRRGRYNFIEGSADHNRLVYMLLSGNVDALLAVDFRFTLPEETRRLMEAHVQTTVERRVPVFITLSRHLANEHPAFSAHLRQTLEACNPVSTTTSQ